MSLTTALAAAAALAAGSVGAVTAYQLAAPEPTSTSTVDETGGPSSRPARPRFAPCEKPAELEAGRCVTRITRSVPVSGGPVTPRPSDDASPFDDDSRHRHGDDHGDDSSREDHGGDGRGDDGRGDDGRGDDDRGDDDRGDDGRGDDDHGDDDRGDDDHGDDETSTRPRTGQASG